MKNLDEIKEQGLAYLFSNIGEHYGTTIEKFLEQCPSFNEKALIEMMGKDEKYTSKTNGINLFEQIMKLAKGAPLDEQSVLDDYAYKAMDLSYQAYSDDSLCDENRQEIANYFKELSRKISVMKTQQKNTKKEKREYFQDAFNDLFYLYQSLENTPQGMIFNAACERFAKRGFIATAIEDYIDEISESEMFCDEYGNPLKGRGVENFFIKNDPFTSPDYPDFESVIVRNIAYTMAGDLFDKPIQEFIDNNVLDEKELEKFINNNTTKARKQ